MTDHFKPDESGHGLVDPVDHPNHRGASSREGLVDARQRGRKAAARADQDQRDTIFEQVNREAAGTRPLYATLEGDAAALVSATARVDELDWAVPVEAEPAQDQPLSNTIVGYRTIPLDASSPDDAAEAIHVQPATRAVQQ